MERFARFDPFQPLALGTGGVPHWITMTSKGVATPSAPIAAETSVFCGKNTDAGRAGGAENPEELSV